MRKMDIITVQDRKDWILFHEAQQQVYRQDPTFITPLRMEVENVFNPQKNEAYSRGQARCFVLLDGERPVGRIAAFIDENRNVGQPYRSGGIGYFECINNPAFAKMLFHTAESFLKGLGVELIDGHINFGERDKYWGLLVHNFSSPLYQENYNPPYYEKLFLDNGFIPFEQILTYAGDTANIPVKRLAQIAQRLKSRHPLRVEPFDFRKLDTFARDFAQVYNAAFGNYPHFNPVSPDHVRTMMQSAKSILDPDMACLAYYEDYPAGFVALYPDINPLIKGFEGKLNLFTIPQFMWRKKRTHEYNAKGMGFGIDPAHRSKGIFALLIEYLCSERNLKRYPTMFLAAIRTHNHEIRSIYDKLQVHIDRVHVAYRKPLATRVKVSPFEFIDLPNHPETV